MAKRQRANFYPGNGGSERRGTYATPRGAYIGDSQQQSRRDKKELLDRILRQRQLAEVEQGIGNKELPAYKHKAEIIATIEANKATLIGGATGSGKSTQVPQYLYEAGYDKTFVLVPRRVIANGLYERLDEELHDQLGTDADGVVGMLHGERVEYSEENKIVVLTPQTFVKMEREIREKHGDDKVAIIVDEIHEANLHSEIAAGIAGMSVSERDTWRLVASSATHDMASLARSFHKINQYDDIPTVHIEGRPYSVDVHEEPDRTSMELYADIGEGYDKSILFTSGKKEIDHIINETRRELERRERGSSSRVVFRKLHGELTEVELSRINDDVPEGSRLAIVSSPAGNSGITIPGVQLVITDGTVNRSELDEDGAPGLIRQHASRAEITQQMGRAGRDVSGGIAYLTPPVEYDDNGLMGVAGNQKLGFLPIHSSRREDHAPAEIYNTRLARTVLEVAGINRVFSRLNPYLPHGVEYTDISQAESLLMRIGAFDEDNRITSMGRDMDAFALSPELSRGLVEVRRNGRTQEQLVRAAYMAVAVETGGLQDFSQKDKRAWTGLLPEGVSDDYSAQLHLLESVGATQYDKPLEWIKEYDLHPKRVQQARKLAAKVLRTLRIDPRNVSTLYMSETERSELLRDMTAGVIDNVYERAGKNRRREDLYRNIHGDETSTVRRMSTRSSFKSDSRLVAGFPRYFINKYGHTEHILEFSFPVEASHVGEFAVRNDILEAKSLPPEIRDGKVVEMEQPSFGSIIIGQPKIHTASERIPSSSQELLLALLYDKPGRKQRSLIEIAKQLQTYKTRLPEGEFASYLRADSPEIITTNSIDEMLRDLVKSYRSQSEIEGELQKYIYSKRISVREYLSQEAIEAIQQRIPDEIHLEGFASPVRLNYSGSSPYITNIHPTRYKLFTGPIYLDPEGTPDRREVLVQIGKDGGRGTRRVSAADLVS